MSDLTTVDVARAGELAGELLIVGCFEGEGPSAGELPEALAAAVERLAERPGWEGRRGQAATAGAPGGGGSVLLVGLGRSEEFDRRALAAWLARMAAAAREQCATDAVLVAPRHAAARGEEGGELIGRQLALGGYRYDRFREPRPPAGPERFVVVPEPRREGGFAAGVERGTVVARAVAAARDLANTPPNVATPAWMADEARSLAERRGMEIEVLEPRHLESRGMGGILAVGNGSVHRPRMVRLAWGEGERRVALVGKGVTFDTGGISIKPAKAMDEMKYDKCGACTVLGVARAVCDLGLAGRFRAYLPLAENMLDGASYRPGDIVRCYGGKSVEIVNTDAEGRMILADALAWAAEEGADTLLEFSTLTGACVVALGETGAGLYTPDDDLASGLLASAGEAGERLWRMPLWSEFREEMKGHHADLRNLGGRWGGANAAAAFLASFVGEVESWAHLDIAGPAYVGSNDGDVTPGATGFGVALTAAWLRRGSS